MWGRVPILLLTLTATGCGARSELVGTDVDEPPPTAGEGGGGAPNTSPSGPICPAASTPTPLVTSSSGHGVVEVDSSYVFVGTHAGEILRMTKALGAQAVTLAETESSVRRIALDTTHVTWATASGGVYRVPKEGGEPVTIAEEGMPTMVAVDDDRIYWVVQSESPNSDSLFASAKDGSSRTTLASGIDQATWIGADGSGVYFSTAGMPSALYRVSADDDDLSLLSEGRIIRTFVVDAGDVWAISNSSWHDAWSSRIERIDKMTGTREVVAYPGSTGRRLAVDESDIYFTSGYVPPDLLRVPKSATELDYLDFGYWAGLPDGWPYVHNAFLGVAIDSSAVYWTNSWDADTVLNQEAGGVTFVQCKLADDAPD